MSAGLSATDRDRLAKLLGMLGSAHIGERDAAAIAATKLVRKRGLTWPDVLALQIIERRMPLLGTWRTKCAQLLERRGSLRPWELRFVSGLPAFPRLSVKQRYVLDEIVARVLGEDDPS